MLRRFGFRVDGSLRHDLQRVVEHLVGFEADEFRHGEPLIENFQKVVDVGVECRKNVET